MPRLVSLVSLAAAAALSLVACASTEPVAPSPETTASPSSSPTQSAAPAPSTSPSEATALPPLPQACGDLDSPEAAAAAGATDYAPGAQGWDRPQDVEELPAAVVTCAWAPSGGSDSFVTVGVYEADEAAIAALEQGQAWDVSQVGGIDLHAFVEDGFSSVEQVWAARDGRVVYVTGSQATAAIPIAQAVIATVLGS